jgi:glycosyltransferase involved in cell wall biosynthesis
MEYDFCIVINTYNRPELLEKLIEDINKNQKNYNIIIGIFDDCSTVKHTIKQDNVKKFYMFPNMGKKKYYVTFNASFSFVKSINSKYYIYLPDDVRLIDNFFDEVKRIYESITSTKKICLSILTDNRINGCHWGYNNPKDFGEFLQTQWNDLCFISEKKFFEVLDYKIEEISEKRWMKNSNLSSGVGYQITERLNKIGKFLYHTKKSLVNHGNHESKMNKIERKKNKLLTL